jgi:hypothetical protein
LEVWAGNYSGKPDVGVLLVAAIAAAVAVVVAVDDGEVAADAVGNGDHPQSAGLRYH